LSNIFVPVRSGLTPILLVSLGCLVTFTARAIKQQNRRPCDDPTLESAYGQFKARWRQFAVHPDSRPFSETLRGPYMRVATCAVILLGAASLLPTLLVDIPAMADYPNHLARMYVLTDVGTPNENPYYEVSFALYPNLAMDLVVPQLARSMNVENATRLFFLFAQLLIIIGAVAIEWVVKQRHEIAGFAALLSLQSIAFSFGFVNFEFGLGVALFGIASWIAFEHRKWYVRFAVHALFACVLFVAHLFALGVYGLALGLYELRRMFVDRVDTWRALATALMLAAPVLVMMAIVYRTGGAIGGTETEWLFSWKPIWAALSLNAYDIQLSAGSMAALLVLIGYLAAKRQLEISDTGKWIGIGFLIAFIALPFKIFDSRMADVRMIAAAFLILPAFMSFRFSRQSGYAGGFIVSTLIALNAGYAAHVWLSYRSDYEEMKASFALLQPCSFVLVADSRTGEVSDALLTDAPMFRAPTLAVHYARAFVSSLYTIAGQVPVEVRSRWQHLDVSAATETYAPPSLATLRTLAAGQDVADAPHYLRHWTQDFQYVYLIGAHTENALPGVLDELARYRRFTLYIVRK
jgi:hypothetical protein